MRHLGRNGKVTDAKPIKFSTLNERAIYNVKHGDFVDIDRAIIIEQKLIDDLNTKITRLRNKKGNRTQLKWCERMKDYHMVVIQQLHHWRNEYNHLRPKQSKKHTS